MTTYIRAGLVSVSDASGALAVVDSRNILVDGFIMVGTTMTRDAIGADVGQAAVNKMGSLNVG